MHCLELEQNIFCSIDSDLERMMYWDCTCIEDWVHLPSMSHQLRSSFYTLASLTSIPHEEQHFPYACRDSLLYIGSEDDDELGSEVTGCA